MIGIPVDLTAPRGGEGKMLVRGHLPCGIDVDCSLDLELWRGDSECHSGQRVAYGEVCLLGECLDEVGGPLFWRVLSAMASAVAAQIGREDAISLFSQGRAYSPPALMVGEETMDEKSDAVAGTPFVDMQLHLVVPFRVVCVAVVLRERLRR